MGAGRRILRVALKSVLVFALFLLACWTLCAVYYTFVPWAWLRGVLTLLYAALLIALFAMPGSRRMLPWVVLGGFVVALVPFLLTKPSNDRSWIAREAKTAWAEIDGELLTVHNVRNTRYRTEEDCDVRWETRTYDLRDLKAVWFVLSQFQRVPLAAHTFVSFEFEDDTYLAISIEGRKEVGEGYGIFGGLFRQYETMYIAGDERDLIGLRTHVRGDTVYLYPMRSTEAGRRAFLLDMVRRMNELHEEPVFYNTLFDTCTTGLHEHLNHVRREPFPLSYEILVSGLSDRRAHKLGLIDTDLPFAETRARHEIDPASASRDAEDFSVRIRGR